MAIKGMNKPVGSKAPDEVVPNPYPGPFNKQEAFVTGDKAATQHVLARKPETEQMGAEGNCKGYYSRQIRKFRIDGEVKYVLNNCYTPVNAKEKKLWNHYVKMKMAEIKE